jgi:hypothetical protein
VTAAVAKPSGTEVAVIMADAEPSVTGVAWVAAVAEAASLGTADLSRPVLEVALFVADVAMAAVTLRVTGRFPSGLGTLPFETPGLEAMVNHNRTFCVIVCNVNVCVVQENEVNSDCESRVERTEFRRGVIRHKGAAYPARPENAPLSK